MKRGLGKKKIAYYRKSHREARWKPELEHVMDINAIFYSPLQAERYVKQIYPCGSITVENVLGMPMCIVRPKKEVKETQ